MFRRRYDMNSNFIEVEVGFYIFGVDKNQDQSKTGDHILDLLSERVINLQVLRKSVKCIVKI